MRRQLVVAIDKFASQRVRRRQERDQASQTWTPEPCRRGKGRAAERFWLRRDVVADDNPDGCWRYDTVPRVCRRAACLIPAPDPDHVRFRVTKLEAARRQLETAIDLWFAGGDPVAIHTLVFAAHEIIHRLYRNAGHKGLLFDAPMVAEESRKDFARVLKADAAFFKHAERDSELGIAHEFHSGRNDLFLAMSLFGLASITDKSTDKEWAALAWFMVRHPDWFVRKDPSNASLNTTLDTLRSVPKHEFLRVAAELRSAIRVRAS